MRNIRKNSNPYTRREFLKSSTWTGLAALAATRFSSAFGAESEAVPKSARVAVTAGDDRASNVFRGLKSFEREIRQAIGNRRVVIKPNIVSIDVQLASTHAGALEGILEFLKSIGKLENAVIAESAANGPTFNGFENFRYTQLGNKYSVKLADLDQEAFDMLHVFDEKDFRPHPVRMSRLLLDPNSFVISAAKMKTHDRVIATLSLKNIIVGAPIKDAGFRWGPGAKAGAKTDKPITHGNGFRGINYNLFALAPRLHPHLSVIDGFDGMQGNGPVGGTAVDHRVSVVGLDWLAADRVAVELMGIDFAKIGYLNYCAGASLGEADLNKIEIVGEPIAKHIKPYKLHDRLEQQLVWMKPVQPG